MTKPRIIYDAAKESRAARRKAFLKHVAVKFALTVVGVGVSCACALTVAKLTDADFYRVMTWMLLLDVVAIKVFKS